MVEGISELSEGVLLGERYRLVHRLDLAPSTVDDAPSSAAQQDRTVGAARVAGVEYEYWLAVDVTSEAEVWIEFAAADGVYADGAALAGAVSALRRINHPAVPVVHAFGEYEFEREGVVTSVGYCAMPAVAGETLAAVLLREEIDRAEILAALVQAAEVFELLAEFELVHAHLSAHSVLLASTEGAGYEVVLVDLPASLAVQTAAESELTVAADVYALAWLIVLTLVGPAVLEAEFGSGYAVAADVEVLAEEVVQRRRAWAAENLVVLGVSEVLAGVLLAALGEAAGRPRASALTAALRSEWMLLATGAEAEAAEEVAAEEILAEEAAAGEIAAEEVVAQEAAAGEIAAAEIAAGEIAAAEIAAGGIAAGVAAEAAEVSGEEVVAEEIAGAARRKPKRARAAKGAAVAAVAGAVVAAEIAEAGTAQAGAGSAGSQGIAGGAVASGSGSAGAAGGGAVASGSGSAAGGAVASGSGEATETIPRVPKGRSGGNQSSANQSGGNRSIANQSGGNRSIANQSAGNQFSANQFSGQSSARSGPPAHPRPRRPKPGVLIGAGVGVVIVVALVIGLSSGSSNKSNAASSGSIATQTAAASRSAGATSGATAVGGTGTGAGSSAVASASATAPASTASAASGSTSTAKATGATGSMTFPSTLTTIPASASQAVQQIQAVVNQAKSELTSTERAQLNQILTTLNQAIESGQSLSSGMTQFWALLHSNELPSSLNTYLTQYAEYLSASQGS